MKKLLVLFPLWGMFAVAFAQDTPPTTQIQRSVKDLLNLRQIDNVLTFDTRYEGVRGKPTIFEDWKPGIIVLNDSSVFRDIQINYDAYNEQLVFLAPSGEAMLASDRMVDRFYVEGDRPGQFWLFKKKPIKGPDDWKYVRIIYEGSAFDVYQVFEKRFREADYEAAYSPDRRYDEFVDDTYLMVWPAGEKPEKLRTRTRAFLKVFPDHQKEMREFLEEHSPDLGSPDDLIIIFRHYESLAGKE
ncbi:MAG: hypothetical protein ACP5D1_08835 [Bacteroidales bacterium]